MAKSKTTNLKYSPKNFLYYHFYYQPEFGLSGK